MLELQKVFLTVRFFNRISCNKGLNAKISRFFTCFFCLTPLGLECFRSRKTASFLTSHGPMKYKNLHPRSFTNGAKTWMLKIANFCRKIASFYQLSEWNENGMFYNCSLFWRYLNSSMTNFSSEMLPFPNSNDLNSGGPLSWMFDWALNVRLTLIYREAAIVSCSANFFLQNLEKYLWRSSLLVKWHVLGQHL